MTNVLITSSRMPFALDEVRKLGRSGCRVCAADTFRSAPGSHSRYVAERFIVPSPRYRTHEFLQALGEIIVSRNIELFVPCFEEVLYVAQHLPRFTALTEVFASSFSTLLQLHDKTSVVRMAADLGVSVPRTILVHDQQELEIAVAEFSQYFARAAFSRGGVQLLTNCGPLRGAVSIAECHPGEENPWLVQEFISGVDVCTFSIARAGKVVAHATYEHPKTMEHAGGTLLESIVDPRTLEVVQKFVEATNYHGQIGFDFRRTDDALVLIECNPRPTNGVTLMSTSMFYEAVFGAIPVAPVVVPAGIRRKMSSALLRNMLLRPHEAASDLAALRSGARDIYARKGDLLPALYQVFSLAQVERYRRAQGGRTCARSDLLAAYFHDICWNGEPAGHIV